MESLKENNTFRKNKVFRTWWKYDFIIKTKDYLIWMVCVDYGIKSCADITAWQENCYFVEVIKNFISQFNGERMKWWSHFIIYWCCFFSKCIWCEIVCYLIRVRSLCALSHKISCDGPFFSPCAQMQRYDKNDEIWRLSWRNYTLSFFNFMQSNELCE
jgi:hypothetical protein